MTNATVEDDVISTITEVFLTWIQNDILPVCMAACDIIIIIIGVILNVLLIVTFKKRGLFNEPSSHFVFMMTIVDFIAYPFLLLPNIITACASKWILPDAVCNIHGSSLVLGMLLNVSFLCVLAIERVIKIVNDDEEIYEKTFENKKFVNVVTIIIWLLSTVIAFIPTSGVADIVYTFYHQGCMLDYSTQEAFLHVHFVLLFVASIICFSVCYGMIFETRRKAVTLSRAKRFKKVQPNDRRKTLSSNESALPTINEGDDDVFNGDQTGPETSNSRSTSNKPNDDKGKKRPTSPRRQSMLFEVFGDDSENPAFHLSITYLALWTVIFFCYLPYFIVWFYEIYNPNPIWGGFYTITLLLIHLSFVVKPIIYLGHNRHYQNLTKETIPDAVKNRARSMRTSIGGIADKVDDFVFRSNSNKKFAAALQAQKAVLIWKKKLNKKTGTAKFQETTETSAVKAISITNKTDDNQSPSVKPSTNQPPTNALSGPDGGRSVPVTPSGVMITKQSSFIEKERERLRQQAQTYNPTTTMTRDQSDNHSPSSPIGMLPESPPNTNSSMSVPGSVNHDDRGQPSTQYGVDNQKVVDLSLL